MKLQLALDFGGLDDAMALARELIDQVNIIEVGTPLLIREGIKAVARMKEAFPDREILADVKIMDAGDYEAKMAFENGADIVTVMGVANDATIGAVQKAAAEGGKNVMVDMMCVADLASKVRALQEMNVAYVCVHRAVDVSGRQRDPFYEMKEVREYWPDAGLAVAGGIDLTTIDATVKEKPFVVIVGRAVSGAENPREVARAIKCKL